MKKIILAVLLLPLFSVAQKAGDNAGTKVAVVESKDGLRLDQGSWTEILAKAKKENKYIIMDCMTTWCGPCKFMDKNIFPLKETGDFFNEKFIAVKVQFDSTADDDARVKSWKKDMKEIEKQYAINAYPTYLMFDPNGQVVHRSVGSTVDVAGFIEKGMEGLNPETQYYTQLRKFEGGQKDPASARKMALMAQKAYDTKKAQAIAQEYIATITDFYTKDNIEFLSKFTSKSTDKLFTMALETPEKVDAVIGEGRAKSLVQNIVLSEEVMPALRKISMDKTNTNPDYSEVVANATKKYPQFTKEITDYVTRTKVNIALSPSMAEIRKISADKNTVTPDYSAIVADAVKKYPQYTNEITDYAEKSKISFYLAKKEWSTFKNEVLGYMTKYGENKLTPAELNNYAWSVFENCKDMTCVAEALDWSRKSFKDKDNSMFMDTYANILHKMGRTKEAIEIQKKALALIPEADTASRKAYQATLEKMQKGEKTWTEE
ncbi:MAG: thioredoxin fold domain-containing protein [Bacteroidota bacterium]